MLVTAEVALSAQALMPLWKVILLEDLEVRALLGEHRQRVAVKTHANLAPAVATAGDKGALLDRIESVEPLVQTAAGCFLHKY